MGTGKLKRGAGVLMPISSLPGPYGIGSLGREAYRFADFVKASGGIYWQVLPIGPTSYGDSPYQSFSAFAGNPYFIDLDTLAEEGLLSADEINSYAWGENEQEVDYAAIYRHRFEVLRLAFSRSRHADSKEYQTFETENSYWLADYSLYMAVKGHFDNRSWQEWEDDIRLRRPEAVARYQEELKTEIAFWSFCQYKFDEQWKKLKNYVRELGIDIIGDIPLYVALDSADVWVHSDLFELDEDLRETNIAGVPPDMFSETGQRWGNPIYRWDVMEQDGFAWWKERMRFSAYHYDVIRIDHFIGVVNYYSIPASCPTAMEGEWKQGPGKKLTDMINETIGEANIIAEDLGVLTQPVKDLIEFNEYPGMKILEFGLDLTPNNEYLPHNYKTDNSIVYIGTHDNETLMGYLNGCTEEQKQKIAWYFGAEEMGSTESPVLNEQEREVKSRLRSIAICKAMIRTAYATNARVAILQVQDMLLLDNRARTNFPSTLGGNWKWRMSAAQYDELDAGYYRKLAALYHRV